eukprot:403332781
MHSVNNKRGSVQSQDKAIINQQRQYNGQIIGQESLIAAAQQNALNSMPRNKEKHFIIKKANIKRIRESNNNSAITSSKAQSQISSPIHSRKQSTDPSAFGDWTKTAAQTNKNKLRIENFIKNSDKSMKQSRQQQKRQIYSEQNSPIRSQIDQLNIQIPTVSKFYDQIPQQKQPQGKILTPNNSQLNKLQGLQANLQQSEQLLNSKNNLHRNNNVQISAKSSMITDEDLNESHQSSQYFANNRGDGSPESDQLAMRKRKNFQSFEKSNFYQNLPKRQITQNFEAIKKRGGGFGDNIDIPQSAGFKLRDNNLRSQNGSNINNNQSSTFETTLNANPAILALSSKPQFSKDQPETSSFMNIEFQSPKQINLNQELQANLQQSNNQQQYASVGHIAKLQQEIDRLKYLVKQKDHPNKRGQNYNQTQDLEVGVFQKRRPGTSNKRSSYNLISQTQLVSPSNNLLNNSNFLNQSQSSNKDSFFNHARQIVPNSQIRQMIKKQQLQKKDSNDSLLNPLTPDCEKEDNLFKSKFLKEQDQALLEHIVKHLQNLKIANGTNFSKIPQKSHFILEHDPVNGRLGFSYNNKEIELDESHYHPTFIAKDIEEIRNNPETRKILKQFQLFTGVSHVDTKTNQTRGQEQSKKSLFGDPERLFQESEEIQKQKDNQVQSKSYQLKEGVKKPVAKASPKANNEPKSKINSDLITVYKNDSLLKQQAPALLHIPNNNEKDQSKSSSPRMNVNNTKNSKQVQLLEKKISHIQTPPMRSSKNVNLIKQSNLNAIKKMRRESHESSQMYHQKLSLTSVLTPSFAKGQADTPSGKSDFSFAIKDMFSERSSGGSSQNFSEEHKRTLSKALLNHKKGNKTLIMNRQQLQSPSNIYRIDSYGDQKSRQHLIDQGNLAQQQSSNFSFHQYLAKEIQLNQRPSVASSGQDIAEKQIQKQINFKLQQQKQSTSDQISSNNGNRKQAYEYLQSKEITCSIKALQPNHVQNKGNRNSSFKAKK